MRFRLSATSRSRPGGPAHYYEIQIDTQKNQPIIVKESEVEWDHPARGTRVPKVSSPGRKSWRKIPARPCSFWPT